ncbi:hypothetical protein H310_13328 [Aphanomyces invadans]|uniref:STAS domain-containing protein n=1 Tax=Aphanomyces invadans TaxID=157072 RepID=A0A024TEJ9_9STRA|nr:hypothetical protein H310_13328 [Aphanomyces invadans]ETV92453.1 hypothetical protein H310_13328 [Aphanomyces invadans]|eukprot:XP_008879004.1 hypothetical protein H310_13328 [Aphanomyces invadans]
MATNSMGSVCNTPRDHTRAARYSSHSLISIEPSAVYPPVEGETSSSENAIKAAMYGFINAIFLIPVTMSFTAIIFSDPFFQPYMPALVKLVGFSCAVHQTTFTLKSSLPFAIGQVQDAGLIFLSAISSSIVTMLSADKDLPPSAVIATTLVTLSSATMLMGLALILTGHYKLASLVQYLPMPVIGGYLSFIGFFCLEAGMGLMAGVEIKNIMDWWKLSNTAALVHILPGILCGLVLFVMSSKVQHFLVLPCCLTFILLSFYAFLVVSGLTFDDVRHAGWVSYAPAAVSSPLDVFDLFDFSLVQWRVIPKQIVTWLGMYFVVAFSSSLDVAAIEMNMGTELDYNHELKTVGWSNAVSGLCGGFTGSYIFSQTIFTLKSNTNSRIPGIVVLVSELIIFVLPLAVTAYIPKFFFGALLSLIAIDLMMEWLIHAFWKLRFREYLIVVSTFVLINVLGLESGMLGGLVCAMTNFVFTYSEGVSVLKMFSRSRVQRNYQDRQYLTKHQCQIVALELHGYFFFGSSIRLVEHIKNNIYVDASKSNRSIAKESTPLLVGGVESSFAEEDPTRFICTLKDLDDLHGSSLGQRKTMLEPETRPTQFLLLDFQHVTGIDATASRSCFQAIKTILARHSITLMFSRMSADLERQLEKNQVLNDADADSIMIFKSVDAGLEFCENMLLNERPPPTPSTALQAKDLFPKAKRTTIMNVSTLTSVLSTALESWSTDGVNLLVEPTHNMEKYFTKKVLAAGERVFSQSDTTSSLFVVGSGELEVYKETTHSSAPNRIIKVSEGSLVGDVDFYLEQERSFTCQATSPSVVYELTRESLDRMVKSDPQLCTAIQTVFLKCMSLGVHNHLLVNHNPLSDK